MRYYAFAFICMMLVGTAINAPAESPSDSIKSLIEARSYQQAIQELQQRAKLTKNVDTLSDIFFRLGEIHYNYTHTYLLALKTYNRIIELSARGLTPDDLFLAYIKKGDVYCRIGQYDNAIKTYQTLVDQFPSTHIAHQTCLQKIRNIQTAREDLRDQQQVIKTYHGTSQAVQARFQIGELYRSHYQLNQPKRAIAEYELLVKQHETAQMAPEAQWRIGNLRHKVLNQPEGAVSAYQKVVDNYPTSNFAADALFQIARVHEEQGQYQLAVSIFDQLPQRYPNFWNMHAVFYWSGVCYEKLHDYRRALRGFKTFLYVYLPALDPAYLGTIGKHVGTIGKHDESLFLIKNELRAKIQKLEADFPKVEWERIQQLINEENHVAALPLAQQLIADVPDSEYAQTARNQLQSLEQYAAIQNLQAQIQKQPGTPTAAQAQFQIGKIYESGLQDYPKAIKVYRQLIDAFPKSPWAAEAMYRTGAIYAERLDNPKEAIKRYQTVVKQYASSAQAMMANFQLGEIYHFLHRYDEALEAYQTTIAFPERDVYLAEGYKDSYADRAQFRIGRVHYEDGRYDDAATAFKAFIKSRPQSPRSAAAYVYLALIDQERSQQASAAKAFAKARSLTIRSRIQAEMVIDEIPHLGFQSTDARGVIQRLDELHDRLNRN